MSLRWTKVSRFVILAIIYLQYSSCLQGLDEVEAVEFDVDEDVEHLDPGRPVHGDEAAVAVVDHEVAAQGAGGEVVHAARPVRHVRHDHSLRSCKLRKNIRFFSKIRNKN